MTIALQIYIFRHDEYPKPKLKDLIFYVIARLSARIAELEEDDVHYNTGKFK